MEEVILSVFKKQQDRKFILSFPPVALIALSAIIITLLAISSAGAQSAEELETRSQELNDQYNQALMDLVAVDSQVGISNAEITSVQQQQQEIQDSIEAEKQNVQQMQQHLEERKGVLEKRLLSTYKSDSTGIIEVIMGAEDFSDFLNKVDMVSAIAEDDRNLIESIKDQKQDIEDEIASLQEKQMELENLVTELASAQENLLTAQAQQQAVLGSIQSERDLNAEQQAQLASQAASIEANMNSIQQQSSSPGDSGGGYNPPAGGGSNITVTSTAYCLAGTTATGMPVGRGIIAVDPGVIPLGSRVHVSGYGDAIAADTGGSIVGNKIDVWLPCGEANAWGVRTVTVTIY